MNGKDKRCKNLIPNSERTPEELREMTRKGGIASGKARREKADMRKLMKAMLDENVKEGTTHAQRLTQSILNIAENPKNGAAAVRAYETILRIVGQDVPDQSIVASDVTIEEMREYFRQKADS